MKLARIRASDGELWVSVNDLRDALTDDELIEKAAAMLKVSFKDKGDDALTALRMAFSYLFTEATGLLRHTEN